MGATFQFKPFCLQAAYWSKIKNTSFCTHDVTVVCTQCRALPQDGTTPTSVQNETDGYVTNTTWVCRRRWPRRQHKRRNAFVLNKTILVTKAVGTPQHAFSTGSSRATGCPRWHLNRQNFFLTLPSQSRDRKEKQFWTSELFIRGDIHHVTNWFYKMCSKWRRPSLCCETYLYKFFLLSSVHFPLHTMHRQIHRQNYT